MGANFEKPEGYLPRVADVQIERYLKAFGAVEIAGTKWCGKTWSALMHGASVSHVDGLRPAASTSSFDKPHRVALGNARREFTSEQTLETDLTS